MDGWERSHFDISFQDAGVALFLSEIGSPVVEFDSRSPGTRPPRTGGSGGSSGGGGGGEGGRRRRHRGARALGRPSVVGVDAAELGNSLVSYDADYNRICINYEHPRFGWMKGLSPRLDGEVKIIIHAMVSNSFTEHVDEFNDVPQDEQLFSAVTAASAAARYKKANPRKFITPRVEQKD